MTGLQIANQFFYNNAVSRVQTKIKKNNDGTFKTQLFTGLMTSSKINKVISYDHNKKIKLLDFAAYEEYSKREWYSVQFAETEIFQISKYRTRILSLEDGTFVKRKMAHLRKSPGYEKIKSLSLCLVQKEFVWVIGGPGRPGTMGMYSHGVYRFNLQENVWDEMPSTN